MSITNKCFLSREEMRVFVMYEPFSQRSWIIAAKSWKRSRKVRSKERTLKLLKITGRILLTLCPALSKTKIWSTERSLMNVNTNLSHVERNYARSELNPGAEPWNWGLPPCAAGTDRVTLELQSLLSNKKINKKPLQVLAHSFLLMLETPKRELMTIDGNPLH